MPRKKKQLIRDPLKSERAWTPDVSLSDISSLPVLPSKFHVSNVRFVHLSYHSQVYLVDFVHEGEQLSAILKVFSKDNEQRYQDEVNAYRLLNHYDVPSRGVVPKLYGILPNITEKKLHTLLGVAQPNESQITFPASAILIEYIEGAEMPTKHNMTVQMAEEILRGLRLIHNAHVLHYDTEPRNILITPATGKAVWIDFSNAEMAASWWELIMERDLVRELVYRDLVLPT